jgi:hypothetical protein
MKRALILAGSLGIASLAGLVGAGSASAAPPDATVGCAPVVLCRIVSTPEHTVNSLRATPGATWDTLGQTATVRETIRNTPRDTLATFKETRTVPQTILNTPQEALKTFLSTPAGVLGTVKAELGPVQPQP